MTATPPAIVVESLTKRFRRYRPHAAPTLKTVAIDWLRRGGRPVDRLQDPNRFDALRDVHFDVARGETFGVIGRNGSGKSTLLKTIAGIYRPDAGRVSVRGRLAALIELGAGFHPEFSGRENILINGIILGLGRRQVAERLDRIVAFAELEDFVDAPVRTYSSGMYMRLAFSIAVHVDPDVLLIDEVLAVGDEAFQQKCRGVLEARARSGHQTTLIVSHDMEAIAALCRRVLLIDRSRAVLYDVPAHAVERYHELCATAE